MTDNLIENIEEKKDKLLESAKWAFMSYARQQGFKDHIEYAKNECEIIKSFINSLLKSQRAELIEEIEGMRKEVYPQNPIVPDSLKNNQYNQAIEDVLTKLKNK